MNLYMTENQKRKLTEVVTLIPENVKDILQEIRIPAYNIENGGVTKKFDMYLIFSNETELPEEFDKANYMEDGEFDEGAWLDAISDWLSEDYGFCHDGFKISKEEKDQEIQEERE